MDAGSGETLPGGPILAQIIDDDVPVYDLSAEAMVVEGGVVIATVIRSMDLGETQTIRYQVEVAEDDTADVNDFFDDSGTLTFEPGELQKIFQVRTTDDTLSEPDETFTLRIAIVRGGPNGGNVGTRTVKVVIADNEGLP